MGTLLIIIVFGGLFLAIRSVNKQTKRSEDYEEERFGG